jgi:hypothetical protein
LGSLALLAGAARADEGKALDALKEVGASITRDDKRPGKPLAVDLSKAKVSDTDLAHLQGLTNLQALDLSQTKVGDAGLAHRKGLANLQVLFLGGTKVSAAGVADLKKALPRCHISR